MFGIYPCIGFGIGWGHIRKNSQSLEDTQVGYTFGKYTLEKYTLYALRKGAQSAQSAQGAQSTQSTQNAQSAEVVQK